MPEHTASGSQVRRLAIFSRAKLNRRWFLLGFAALFWAHVLGFYVYPEFAYCTPVLWPALFVLTTLRLWDAGKSLLWNAAWLLPGALLLMSGALTNLLQEARYEAANVPHFAVNSGDYVIVIGLSLVTFVGQIGLVLWAGRLKSVGPQEIRESNGNTDADS